VVVFDETITFNNLAYPDFLRLTSFSSGGGFLPEVFCAYVFSSFFFSF